MKVDQETRDRIKTDPRKGDWVENRKVAEHPRRFVVDRYLNGDIEYCWNRHSQYYGRCTPAEWAAFCGKGSRILNVSKLDD